MIPSSTSLIKGLASADACAGASRCGSPIRRNHLTPGGAKRQCSIRGEHMTISAQVIDTIVSGLMTTCINRCVLMISLAMPGIRNGICNGCFYSIKGEPGRYIREEAAAGRPRSA